MHAPLPHSFSCRVYFEDTDAGGVVYYANYLKFYERARSEFLRALGFEQDELLAKNIVFVVRNISVDYINATGFNELLLVETRIKQLKKVSLDLTQEIYAARSDKHVMVNQAEVKLACVDAKSFKPTPIPADIYEKLKNNE